MFRESEQKVEAGGIEPLMWAVSSRERRWIGTITYHVLVSASLVGRDRQTQCQDSDYQ